MDIFGDVGVSVAGEVGSVLVQIIVILVGGMLSAALGYVCKKFKIDTNTVLFNKIEDVIDTAVIATNQTVVNQLKSLSDTGALSDDQKTMVFNLTKEKILEFLSDADKKAIIDKYTNLDDGLDVLIEKHVYNNATHYIGAGTLEVGELEEILVEGTVSETE